MTESLDNTKQYLEIRNLIDRYEELENEYILEGADAIEHEVLENLLDELKGYGGEEQWKGDWYPSTLIRDSYFETAMDELLEDCGLMQPYINPPCYINVTINYDALQMDYSSIDIEGVNYCYL